MGKQGGHISAVAAAYGQPMRRKPAVRHSPAVLMSAILAASALAAPVLATPIDANPAPHDAPPDSTPLSGIVVVPPSKEPPSIVKTYPEAGATVMPGALVLKVIFDQRMNPGDFRFDRAEDRYPSCLARPRLLPDEKTFVLLCTVGPSGKFSVQMNGPGAGGFANLANQRATPLLLHFSTQDGASLSTIKDAIKSAGLKDEDDPVMDNRPAGAILQASGAPAKPTP
jgi:hypothetical protein